MMASAGVSAKDLEYVLISHSHEDHDGSLAELVESTRIRVKAHAIYDLLIRQYPEDAPPRIPRKFSSQVLALYHAGIVFRGKLPRLSPGVAGP